MSGHFRFLASSAIEGARRICRGLLLVLWLAPLAGVLATSLPAHANLTIIPTFDSTITSDPNAATIEGTIHAAINTYQATFTDPIIVPIKFQEMTTGLGASDTWLFQTTYTTYLTQLTADKTTSNDAIALAHLPAGPNNPIPGTGSNIFPSFADAMAIGLSPGSFPDGFAGTISVNTSITNDSRVGPQNPTKYDLLAVVSHEIDEVLGLGSGIRSDFTIRPEDLFRYTSTGTRTYTAAGDNAYFSIDGTTDLAQFNQDSAGDYGDWWSIGAHTPQVQDAFGTPGATPNLGVELTALDVIGYDLAPVPHVPEPGTLLLLGSGLVGLVGLGWRKS